MTNAPVKSSPPVAVVVNDDPVQLNILSVLLRRAELEPRGFTDAEAALAAMDPDAPPAIIVTDIYMPGIDGWRFCRLLRSFEYMAFNRVPILVVSATFAGDEPSRIAANIGANAFLPSPVDGKRFIGQVQSLISGKQSPTPLRVLIVEDSRPLVALLRKAFEDNGCRTDTADTLSGAAGLFRKNIYDIAVLDYHLPDGKGDTLLDELHATRPDCVCLMMTTDPGAELALDWMKRGAAAYLRKPFKTDYLIELCTRARRERSLLRVQDLLEVRTRELRRSEEMYRIVADYASDSDWEYWLGSDGRYIYISPSAETVTGYSPDEFLSDASLAQRIVHPADRTDFNDHLGDVMRKSVAGKKHALQFRIITKNGETKWLDHTCRPVHRDDGTWLGQRGSNRDITVRKQAEAVMASRLHLLQMAGSHTLAELLRATLDEAEQLTGSRVGFYHFVESDQVTLSLQTWSTNTTEHMCMAKGSGLHYSVNKADVWVECIHERRPVIHNDYASLPHRKGLPEGHAPVIRELVVPVQRGDSIVAVLGVGNKPTDYDERDIETVASIADLAWDIAESKRKEEAIHRRDVLLDAAARIGQLLLTENDIRQALSGVIHVIGEASGQDRSYLFEAHPDPVTGKTLMSQRYEWVRAGISPQIGNPELQNLPFAEVLPSMNRKLSKGLNVCGRVQDLPPDERELLEKQGILSILLVPVAVEGKYWGFIGFDNCRAEYEWSSGEQSALMTVAASIGSAITHRRAESEREKINAQFLQAQKMESVGRLTGGVAHDFNNMLSVILGNVEMALMQASPIQPLYHKLTGIRDAAVRSATLTRQLLTFARRQTVTPEVLDMNETIEGMLRMLYRLIGENIELAWKPGANLWPVRVDPGQIDQILANLLVNARDAIGEAGKVTIETGNVVLDENDCADYKGSAPGEYVLLSVRDNGCGMEKEVLDRLSEPFFTTKEPGRGTGLGMATVYGIVMQNQGFVFVSSEPGMGTIFRIYLPRHDGMISETRAADSAVLPGGRGETVLLVEDEPAILSTVSGMLETLGYRVLAAGRPSEAIRIAGTHSGDIHLLIADVVMPETNIKELTCRIHVFKPAMKCLFMSGYTTDVISHHGLPIDCMQFIQKPFSLKDMAEKIRSVLELR